MDIYEIVMKLNGPVSPTGDHGADMKRLENLRNLTLLVDMLLGEIDSAAGYATRSEASMSAIGQHARNFINEVQQIGN